MTRTMLLAIGNAGGNILGTICRETKSAALKDAQYIFADCNEEDLNNHGAVDSRLILLDADINEFPADPFDGIEKLIIVAGLGGKTGTTFAELAARCAREHDAEEVVVVTTLPFSFEGEKRLERSVAAVKRIQSIPGVRLFCLNNEELDKKYPNLNFLTAFKAADKEILNVLEKAIENVDTIPACELHQSEKTEIAPPKMYIFSTLHRFNSEVRDKIKGLLTDVSAVEIFLFDCRNDINTTFMSRALALHLHKTVNIVAVNKEFTPPYVNKHDVIIDAIAEDPNLQPLRGVYEALERFISEQEALIHKV